MFEKVETKTIEKTMDLMTEPVKQRLSSPLIGSFAISWSLINWKAIVYLIFSSKEIHVKFEYIETTLYSSNLSYSVFMTFILPLVVSTGYVLYLSRIENWIADENLDPLIKKMNRQSSIVETDLTNKIKEQTKRSELQDAKSKYKDLNEAREQVAELQKVKKTLEQQIKDNETEYSKKITETQTANTESIAKLTKSKDEQISLLRSINLDQDSKLAESAKREEELNKQRTDEEQRYLEKLQEDTNNYNSSLTELNGQISSFVQQTREQADQITQLEMTIENNVNQHNTRVELLLSAHAEEIQGYRNTLEDMKQVNEELQNSITYMNADHETQIKELNDEIATSHYEVEEIVQNIGHMHSLSKDIIFKAVTQANYLSYRPITEMNDILDQQDRNVNFATEIKEIVNSVSVTEKAHYFIDIEHENIVESDYPNFMHGIVNMMHGYNLVHGSFRSSFEMISELYVDKDNLKDAILSLPQIKNVSVQVSPLN